MIDFPVALGRLMTHEFTIFPPRKLSRLERARAFVRRLRTGDDMRYWLFCAWRSSHDNETHFGITRCKRCKRWWPAAA